VLKNTVSHRLFKNASMQGAQILRNEAYCCVRRSDEGCSATQQISVFQQPVRESVTLILNELMPVMDRKVENGIMEKAGMSTGRHTRLRDPLSGCRRQIRA